MFAPKVNTYVDGEIARVVKALEDKEVSDEKYDTLLNRLQKLHGMRQDEKPDTVSSDTIALIAANILGILLIIRHEHVNVISTKAFSMLPRPR